MSQANALGQVADGPALGVLAGVAGVPVALLVASAIQAPNAVSYLTLQPNAAESAGSPPQAAFPKNNQILNPPADPEPSNVSCALQAGYDDGCHHHSLGHEPAASTPRRKTGAGSVHGAFSTEKEARSG